MPPLDPRSSRARRESPLSIDARQDGDVYVVCAQDELDLSGCPGLELALLKAEESQARRILLDLEQLTFIDAGGLQALLKASRRSASSGARLRITRGQGRVADLFRLTALDRALPLVDAGSRELGSR